MIEFVLNDEQIVANEPAGMPLLDFIRRKKLLPGTKIGCREGDCGACTVLVGTIKNDTLAYHSIVSCLTPLANMHGRHVVTIEGINMKKLNPAQQAIADYSATQCGFCTPGFVVALTGYMMSDKKKGAENAISGNICRCTGYKSIQKAAAKVEDEKLLLLVGDEINSMIVKGWLPQYFATIKERLEKIERKEYTSGKYIGGGTDLMVKEADVLRNVSVSNALNKSHNSITIRDGKVIAGAAVNINAFFENAHVQKHFPQLDKNARLFASEQIRNMGTLAGNMVNASPIGDMSIILLALNAEISTSQNRIIRCREFFLDYKKTALAHEELIESVIIPIPGSKAIFNFEKVSKRTYLDIASVNSAMQIKINNNIINEIGLTAGGIAPIPKYLDQTCRFLIGKTLTIETIDSACDILLGEISPISDIRGSKEYKTLLLRQLFLKHFLVLFPNVFEENDILRVMQLKISAV